MPPNHRRYYIKGQSNPYHELPPSYEEANRTSKSTEKRGLLGENIPDNCTRCNKRSPKIRVHYHRDNHLEYICRFCKFTDKNLCFLPVKKISEIMSHLCIPTDCERCNSEPPKIKVYYKNKEVNEYICRKCVDSDPKLNKLPIKKKN